MLFDGVDLALEPRVRACLVGRNGAGKSTLMRIMAGLIEPDGGDRFVTPGTKVALVPQEPLIEGASLLDYATAGGAQAYEAEAQLQAFGLDPTRTTQGLSGGEIRRTALARAFAEDPDVLLLDEPTNHLDIFAIQTLEEAVAASRAAALIVSHDRAFLERVTGRSFWLDERKVWRLDAGFSAFDDWAAKIADQRAEDAKRLQKNIEREEYWLARGVTARRARNEGRRRKLLALREQRRQSLSQARGDMKMALETAAPSGQRVIEAKGLAKHWGERTIFEKFSTRILRGDRIAIAGPNGAGKTTLVKVLLGETAADAGSVKLGTNLEIAYVDQARADLATDKSLWEVLAPAGGDQIIVRGRPRHVAAYAKDFLFRDAQLRQPVSTLSGGERNRLLLALAFARPANLLVLDEPTNDLDMDTLDLLEDLLAEYDGALILVSHDRDFIDKLATSTIALDGRGAIVETPGGWSDLIRQNPGFFDRPEAAKPTVAAKPTAPAARASAKLSYKDQRRLEELETEVPRLTSHIGALETALADPDLYTRDRKRFERLMADLQTTRQALSSAEDEWLALEEKRESLVGSS
ncbi:MAG TPA: ATP-binding cassette domain-containing protein [Caulobacteraceae bacterium]|nr:ATP-binding cassette domain-containing protein [Caulobacteraceae bacterium]